MKIPTKMLPTTWPTPQRVLWLSRLRRGSRVAFCTPGGRVITTGKIARRIPKERGGGFVFRNDGSIESEPENQQVELDAMGLSWRR